MRPFNYTRAENVTAAGQAVVANEQAKFLAGGTNLIDLMKEDVERPTELIDITHLPLAQINSFNGGLSLGALATNANMANHPLVWQRYPLLSQAILAGASGQIRNMATNGGNLNQRTRCPYFYDTALPCNKREPGTGCAALEGMNRLHAIFGWSEQCVAVNPSDMAVALAALNATVKVQTPDGSSRSIRITDYHRLPENTPQTDSTLRLGELITAIDLPPDNFAETSHYLKIRDRSSYAFAVLSVAAALELEQTDGARSYGSGGRIKTVRLAMGGVAHKPWRVMEAEAFLTDQQATDVNFRAAAQIAMAPARPLEHNQFKVELGRRAIVRALQLARQGNPL